MSFQFCIFVVSRARNKLFDERNAAENALVAHFQSEEQQYLNRVRRAQLQRMHAKYGTLSKRKNYRKPGENKASY